MSSAGHGGPVRRLELGPAADGRKPKVLVTGATGFIGGRLVERLMGEGLAEVRAFVSAYTRCSRIARFPVELHRGDLLNRDDVVEAARDCDVIFHCAYGNRGTSDERTRVTVEGTRNIVAAARESGARLVHLSSQVVYALPEKGTIDESSPPSKGGGTYAESKLEAEELVRGAIDTGLPAVILQPTAVYGPEAPVWTAGVLERMRSDLVPLVDGGEGACNAVYIDDVIDAMLLAASRDEPLGDCFLISAQEPVTWREFFGAYEAMLGVPATVPVSRRDASKAEASKPRSLLRVLPELVMSEPTLRSRIGATREGRLLRRLLAPLRPRRDKRSLTPELDRLRRLRQEGSKPAYSLSASEARFYASKARVSIDKARRKLGYRPRFDLSEGMRLTAAWARWAQLVPRQAPAEEDAPDRDSASPSGASRNSAAREPGGSAGRSEVNA